jgi:cyclopropane fatty-acyl-phospholipid synthase-like methyltransferase
MPAIMTVAQAPWRLLDSPSVYAMLMRVLGADAGMARLVREHLEVRPGEKLLDVGCGPGRLVRHLPAVDYVGLDGDCRYLERARRLHPGRRFERVDVSAPDAWSERSDFDIVVASGLLHHLSDPAARGAIGYCHDRLRSGGRLVTLDCALEEAQPLAARWLARADRGRFVRAGVEYLGLVKAAFPDAAITVRHDLLRTPYTHAIIVGHKP